MCAPPPGRFDSGMSLTLEIGDSNFNKRHTLVIIPRFYRLSQAFAPSSPFLFLHSGEKVDADFVLHAPGFFHAQMPTWSFITGHITGQCSLEKV